MTTEQGADEQCLILRDEQGTFFVIPRKVVEQHRVADQYRAEVEQAIGGDTSGFWHQGPSPLPPPGQLPGPGPGLGKGPVGPWGYGWYPYPKHHYGVPGAVLH